MNLYEVVSGEFGEVVPVTDDGQGPTEYGRDYALVEAPTAAAAKWIAARYWEDRYDWRSSTARNRDNWRHPLSGTTAKRVSLAQRWEWERDPDFDPDTQIIRVPAATG